MRDRDEEQQAVAAPSTTRGAGPADEPSASVALPVGPPASAHQLTYAGSDAALYLINADGTGRVKFTDKTECITASFPPLQWSPKGDRLACMASTPDRTQQSLAILDGSGQVLGSMPASGVIEIAWSPTGEALLLQSADTITVVDSHRTLITRLGPTVSSAMTGIQRYSLWSPDGLRIAYWAAHSAELRIFSLESLSEQTVAGDYRPLAWLSRQESILVTSNHQSPANEGGYRSWEVSRLDLWNGNLTRVPFLDAGPPLDRADGLPIRGNQQYWLGPNDLIVVLTTRSDGLSGLGMYDVVTGSFTPIPDSLISFGSDHIPAGAVSYFGKGAQLYWLDFQRGTTIYRANIDGTALQRVADVDSFGAAMSPDATTIAYTEFSGPDPGHPSSSDSLKLYIAGIDGASAVEIDSRPVQGGFMAPFSAVWRPIPPSHHLYEFRLPPRVKILFRRRKLISPWASAVARPTPTSSPPASGRSLISSATASPTNRSPTASTSPSPPPNTTWPRSYPSSAFRPAKKLPPGRHPQRSSALGGRLRRRRSQWRCAVSVPFPLSSARSQRFPCSRLWPGPYSCQTGKASRAFSLRRRPRLQLYQPPQPRIRRQLPDSQLRHPNCLRHEA